MDLDGIHVRQVIRNPSPALLYESALRHERGTAIAASGALVAMSGARTGRSPTDKRAAGIRILHTLTPLGVAMAAPHEFDPFRD